MSRAAAPRTTHRRRWLLIAVVVVVVVAAVAVVHFASRSQDLPEKLSDLIAARDPSCLGGKPAIDRSRPSARPDLYPDLRPYAESLAVVACDYGGPVTVVLGFTSRSRLERAFTTSRGAGRSGWCFIGRMAFDGATLDAGQLPLFCKQLHGTLRAAR